MSLTKFTKDMAIISALNDEPNDVGGMTAAELKAKYDEGGKALQGYVNDTLTVETDAHIANQKNPHGVDKAQLGLGNVDNTADADKPVSALQAEALARELALKADKIHVLEKDNAEVYTPTKDYHPATKRYTDEVAGAAVLGQIPDHSITEHKIAVASEKRMREPGEYAYTRMCGSGELEDTTIEFGTLSNAGAGWNQFSFREAFEDVPTVVLQPENFEGTALIKSVTKSGFLYCLRTIPMLSEGLATSEKAYVGSGVGTNPSHTEKTILTSVTFPTIRTETTAETVKIHYFAAEFGG